MGTKINKLSSYEKTLLDLISSGLKNKSHEVEMYALNLSRLLKRNEPELAKTIIHTLSSHSLNPSFTRGASGPVPTDSDSRLEMATIITPDLELNTLPVLSPMLKETVENFLQEREKIDQLLEKGIKPSTGLLLTGMPGTGKTMLARHIASALNKNLIVLDLSASISSLLGKTGQNLKKVLEYARQSSAVLLLDEFDAIAKRRDDSTDLGEIKRVVNVLLMELESWPVSSVVIATSNHPELLDRAIWRRFDHVLTLDLPEQSERVEILTRELGGFLEKKDLVFIPAIAELLSNKSPADLCRLSQSIKRRVVLKDENVSKAILHTVELYTNDKETKGKFCALAKKMLGNQITVRQLAEITGFSPGGVQYHTGKQE
jgi:SpoVK/Ycf46/Vps4 family AAA+-type ATPase